MLSAQALIQRNIQRSRHSLPFFDPDMRDLIAVLAPLFSEGSVPIGIYGRPGCTRKEFELLEKLLRRKPEIIVGRLPDRIILESLIALPRPSLSGRRCTAVALVCLARGQAHATEITSRIETAAGLYSRYGVPLTGAVFSGRLPELVICEIMRTGIVLGGRHPITDRAAESDGCIHIGDLPRIVTSPDDLPRPREWNPFSHYLEAERAEFIARGDYPCVLGVPSANPFIVPFLHILHRHEERMDKERIDKTRASLLGLFSRFPPTNEAMQDLAAAWKTSPSSLDVRALGFTEALALRRWLVPLEEDELPICAWPPPGHFGLERLSLVHDRDGWSIAEAREFRHAHAWVVLAWVALAGLVAPGTRIISPGELGLKRSAGELLRRAAEAMASGVDLLVPENHLQGSVRFVNGRFFYSPLPFALLEKGTKHSLEIFEEVKKKAMLDDIDLEPKNRNKA
jgi:hypothetical protein